MIKTLLLSICLYLPNMSQAQVNPKVIKLFPAHIVYKIDNVISKINLTEDKQIKIGQKLYTSDSLATISLANGEVVDKSKSYYTIDTHFLKSILSAKELDNYGYEMNKDNRLLIALKCATELKLSTTQLSEIRKQNDSLDYTAPMSAKETIGFYNTKLSKILSKEQYVFLLQTIYKEQSLEDAKKDWVKIQALKLVSEKDNTTEFRKIVNYYIIKNAFLDSKAEKYDNNKIEEITKNLALREPPILIRANILSNGIYKNNRYTYVIKLEKELQLTKIQVDSLLSKYIQIERIRFENKVRKSTLYSPTEFENIGEILTSEQVKKWLVIKNKTEANDVALINWKKLEAESLNNNLDKNTIVKDLATYQLKYLVGRDLEKIYHSQESILMRRKTEQEKPELLKQLDAINQVKSKNTTTKNALTW